MKLNTISYRFTANELALLGRYCDLRGFPIASNPETDSEQARFGLEQDGILVSIGQEARVDALVYKLLTFCTNPGRPRFKISDDMQTFHLIFGQTMAILVEEAPESAVVLTPYPEADQMEKDLSQRIKWPAQCDAGEIRTCGELTMAIATYRRAKEV